MAKVRNIKCPKDLVDVLEAVFVRGRIGVGVSWHDDGSRTYTLPNDGLDVDEAENLVRQALNELANIIRNSQS
jgi:hypothetical protein